MSRDIFCPLCGAMQRQVNLDETDNTFICDTCKTTIKLIKFNQTDSDIEFEIISKGEDN